MLNVLRIVTFPLMVESTLAEVPPNAIIFGLAVPEDTPPLNAIDRKSVV